MAEVIKFGNPYEELSRKSKLVDQWINKNENKNEW